MPYLSQEVIIYILLGITLLLTIFILHLERRIHKLMKGKKGDSLEDLFNSMKNDLSNLQVFQKDIEGYMRTVEVRLRRSIQGMHNVHFKAFEGLESGGNQSFATAFLNEEGDGVILSTLHSRDRVNVFSKPITKFEPKIPLSQEEARALTKAKESCKL